MIRDARDQRGEGRDPLSGHVPLWSRTEGHDREYGELDSACAGAKEETRSAGCGRREKGENHGGGRERMTHKENGG